jgi:hypothetical protein
METEKKDDPVPIGKKHKISKSVTIYNPLTKKTTSKSFSGYDPETVVKNALEWKVVRSAELKALAAEAKSEAAKMPKALPFTCVPYCDPEMPTNGSVAWVLCGASRSGKTTFMKYLYSKYYKKHCTTMMSLSSQADIYKDMSKKIIVANDWMPLVIEDMYRINSKCENRYPFLVITDDLVGNAVKNDLQMTRLLSLYRNSNISSIISGQQATLINASGRSNANFLAIFHQNSAGEAKRVIDTYLTAYFPTEMKVSQKIQFFMKATEGHCFFFINNLNNTCQLVKLGM